MSVRESSPCHKYKVFTYAFSHMPYYSHLHIGAANGNPRAHNARPYTVDNKWFSRVPTRESSPCVMSWCHCVKRTIPLSWSNCVKRTVPLSQSPYHTLVSCHGVIVSREPSPCHITWCHCVKRTVPLSHPLSHPCHITLINGARFVSQQNILY